MKKLLAILTAVILLFSFTFPALAQENANRATREEQEAAAAPAKGVLNLCPSSKTGENETDFASLCKVDPSAVLGTVITFIFVIAIIIALIYLIWGGIKWITSGGDKGNVETARGQIIAAVIGLIIVFLAYFIINIVLQVFLGIDNVDSIGLPSLPDATP